MYTYKRAVHVLVPYFRLFGYLTTATIRVLRKEKIRRYVGQEHFRYPSCQFYGKYYGFINIFKIALKRTHFSTQVIVEGLKPRRKRLKCLEKFIFIYHLRIGSNGDFCEHGSEPSASIKALYFLYRWITTYFLYFEVV